MGQKDYLFKNSPWEESTRVPLVIRAPGVAKPGGIAEHPVSLIDLYPTLADLCGLEGDTRKNEKGAPLDGCMRTAIPGRPAERTLGRARCRVIRDLPRRLPTRVFRGRATGTRQTALDDPHQTLALHPLQQRCRSTVRPR